MFFRKKLNQIIYFLLFFMLLVFPLSGCGEEDGKEGNDSEGENMYEEILELEMKVIETMQLADIAPVLDIVTNEEDNDEDDETKEENNGENEDENNDDEENNSVETQADDENDENEITFEKTIISEIVIRELEEDPEYPENQKELWDEVRSNVTEIHDLWNEIKSELMNKEELTDSLSGFDEHLDDITAYSIEENYFELLVSGNELTRYMSDYIAASVENVIAEGQDLKYLTRDVVLLAVGDNYEKANENVDEMYEILENLKQELESEDVDETLENLDINLDDLQRAVEKEDNDLIKLKSGILMENIIEMTEDIEEEIVYNSE
ncbi:hypothetical protein [Natranaerofaba carboxydovora]|uniref:hypothetical protein n=1 Tax=Natranaerofaba carboxydovora TaxID=2742683 RepID=UPI001F12D314|nr:hypothetical protein [Natranaerofaba carboxydovora]UMZ74184.1 hypothetical protein ACONDI_01764 [Natranaerofaba carboxydovora]